MAASPRPPSWAIGHTELNAGVLGETALLRFWDMGLGPRIPGTRGFSKEGKRGVLSGLCVI